MARIHTVTECDHEQLAARLRPRDDVVVLERLTTDPRLAACEAPTDCESPADCRSRTDYESPTGSGGATDCCPLPRRGTVEFEAAEGPFRKYRRTVTWEPGSGTSHGGHAGDADDSSDSGGTAVDAGTCTVEQTVEFSTAIPYWSALFNPMLRRALVDGPPPGTTPWWSTPDRLSPRQSTVVAAMAMFNLVAGLTYGLLTQVLTFVAADLGDGGRSEQTTVLAVARLGVVVTMVAMVFADRVGRRRIAIWSFASAGVLTVLTAAAPSLWFVGALQLVSRNLAIAGLLCVDTIAVEEIPPGSRAMATSLGTLAYGLGAGVVVMTLPLADLGTWGWRLTFVVAGVALPLIWHASRHLPESHRFERHREAPESSTESRRIHGGRFLLLAAMFFLLNVFVAPSSQLQNDYLRTEQAFSGSLITLFVIATSTPAGIGVLLGGRLADIRGRRAAIVPGLLAIGVFNAIFFAVSGPPMWLASLLGAVIGGMAVPAMGVIAPELFPTAHRGGVRGALTAIAVVGSVCGLVFAGAVVDSSSYGTAFALLAIAPVIGAGLAFAIPETRGRELEDINR